MSASRLHRARLIVSAVLVLAVCAGLLLIATGPAAGRGENSGRWWHPPSRPTWYWQLQGHLPSHIAAEVVDVDGFGTSAATVARLHADGHHVVCYVDVGTWESWRPDAGAFPRSVLGDPDGWPGERWLDLRRLDVLAPIMSRRFAMCAHKGFDAIEPDNLDPLGNRSGFPLTRAEVIRYARWVASAAHARGLAVLQKNGPELAGALVASFDGALVEQCNQFSECGAFRPYLRSGKPVLDAEYDPRLFPAFCDADGRLGIQGVLFNLALNGRRYQPCWARD